MIIPDTVQPVKRSHGSPNVSAIVQAESGLVAWFLNYLQLVEAGGNERSASS